MFKHMNKSYKKVTIGCEFDTSEILIGLGLSWNDPYSWKFYFSISFGIIHFFIGITR